MGQATPALMTADTTLIEEFRVGATEIARERMEHRRGLPPKRSDFDQLFAMSWAD